MNPFSITGKTALVTGAGSGIGEAIVRLFAASEARVWIADRDTKAGESVAAEIRASGGQAEFVALDVADEKASAELAGRIPALDILVNNAGIGHVGNLLSTQAADLDRLFSVNVRGVFNLCKAFAPAMIARGSGSVINVASIGGVVAIQNRLAYTSTKFAVVGLTKALALDHSGSGVRFNAICPARVETPFVKARIAETPDPEKAYRAMCSSQLNGRMCRPDEIAAAALYLASDAAAMITGSTFSIDGGWTAGSH